MATAKKKAPAKKAEPAKKAPAKKSSPKKDPIGDALTRAERAKYGPYTKGNETNYTPGDRSLALRAYSRVTGYVPRTSGGRGNVGGGGMRGGGGAMLGRGK
jgi:hypothetical protein